ncbi:MAG TPA: hypothetical protein VGL34_13520 [Steroidobacteraceae bacterium]|jgi:hypothetical protein
MEIQTQNDKVLFVHAGGTKTGSSALQNFLEMEKDQLRRFGLSYENICGIKSVHEITSGNGVPLHAMLCDVESTDDDLRRMILSYFNETRRAICSCEGLEELGQSRWTKFAQVAGSLGVHLELIFYVRDVIPFFWSGYDQAIKRHGEHRSFAHWAEQANWNHGTTLRKLAAQFPIYNIHVMHYEERTRSIFESFLDVIGIGAAFNIETVYKNSQVNRSLTKQEREALKLANSVLGRTYSKELSDLLIYSNPNAKSEPVFVSKRGHKLLHDLFETEVNWVNETFFNGRGVVSVSPVRRARAPERKPVKSGSPTERNVADKLSYIWAINQLGTIKADVERSTMDQLITVAIRYSQHTHHDLPPDFNVLVYLARNPDVLFSGVDPVQHYLLNGRSEGRLYKYGPQGRKDEQ